MAFSEAWFDDVEKLVKRIIQAHREDCGTDDMQFGRLERQYLGIRYDLSNWYELAQRHPEALQGATVMLSRQAVWMQDASSALRNSAAFRDPEVRVTASVLAAASTLGFLIDDAFGILAGGTATWSFADPVLSDEDRQQYEKLFRRPS